MTYLVAPPDWTPSDPNPFAPDGCYGSEWSCFCIDGVSRRVNYCGSGTNALFTFRLGADSRGLKSSLADFLRYETRQGRRVILSCPDSMDVHALVMQALSETPATHQIRAEDPKWVVHSTVLESWESIRADGAVKSLAALREAGSKIVGLGIEELGEPPDYAEYVVLGRIDEVNAEHVVASRRKGRIVTEPDLPYQPGVRLYFDNHVIIRHGLAVRDGLHTTKVRCCLSLAPYMVVCVSVRDFPHRTWTPRGFWTAANEAFFAKTG